MAWADEHWWIWIILWAVVGIGSIRFTLWERDEEGKWHKDPGFSIFIALTWPALLVIAAMVAVAYGIGKAFYVPLYYWITPAKVRKAEGMRQFGKPKLKEVA